MPHQSDSATQRDAEALIREKLADALGVELKPKSVIARRAGDRRA